MLITDEDKTAELKAYFENEDVVLLAFVFGSRAKGIQRPFSDWDIGIYVKPEEYAELEACREYPDESRIWGDLERILQSDVDLLVLNRAQPPLLFSVLNSGRPLAIKDRRLYLNLLLKTHYEAVDYWAFTKEFFEIAERSRSLSDEDRAVLRRHVVFLENEYKDLEKFRELSRQVYLKDSSQRRDVERWVENLVMTAIDIAKIILASRRENIPQSYRDTLFYFVSEFMDEEIARKFSRFAELRNIIAHEYLDIKWERIKKFIEDSPMLYPVFIERAKAVLKAGE